MKFAVKLRNRTSAKIPRLGYFRCFESITPRMRKLIQTLQSEKNAEENLKTTRLCRGISYRILDQITQTH